MGFHCGFHCVILFFQFLRDFKDNHLEVLVVSDYSMCGIGHLATNFNVIHFDVPARGGWMRERLWWCQVAGTTNTVYTLWDAHDRDVAIKAMMYLKVKWFGCDRWCSQY